MFRFVCGIVIVCLGGCASQKNNIPAGNATPAISKSISGRGVVMEPGQTLESLYEKRRPLY